MPENLKVSVVVPVRNNPVGIRGCVAALRQQSYRSLEIIVVDNGESPADVDLEGVAVVRETAVGSYAARNAGLRAISGEIIAFTDSDCVPDIDWVSNGVTAVQASGGGIVGGKVVPSGSSATALNAVELLEEQVFRLFDQESYVRQQRFATTANLFLTKEALRAVGEFRADLKSGGDREFGHRALARGRKVDYAEAAVVRHPRRRTARELITKVKRVIGGRVDAQCDQKWAKARGLLDLWRFSPANPGVFLFAVMGARRASLATGLQYFGLVYRVSLAATLERIRLLGGGTSARE